MIIGTFWCQREQLWVRFNEENEVVSAEVARVSDNPKVTTAWQAVSEGAWYVSYTEKNNDKIFLYYAIKNDRLYYSEGTINQYSKALVVSERRNSQYFPTRNYSFPNDLKEETEVTPYNELPLTPEMFAEKIRMDEEARKLQQELEAEKWKKIRASDIHQRGVDYIYNQSPFSETMDRLFLDLLKTELAELSPKDSDSVYDYLEVLKGLIENSENKWHQKIVALAAKTEWDSQLGTHLPREQLFGLKKSFLFNVIRAEANSLAQEFNINFKILNEQEIVPKKMVNNILVNENESDHDDHEFNNEHNLMFGFDDDDDDDELENTRELQQCIESSLQTLFQPQLAPRENVNQNLEVPRKISQLDDLIRAVTTAQENYANWYNAGTGYKQGNNLRGENRFFSWLRHGSFGQQRASTLVNDIFVSNDLNIAHSLINDFLKSDSTRYHRHSFASFLLDNLSTIVDSPWHGINCVDGLYDQNAVIDRLNPAAAIIVQL